MIHRFLAEIDLRLGRLPIGDAFLAWSKSARPLVADPPSAPPPGLSRPWRIPLLTVFLLIAAAPWLFGALGRRRRLSCRS
jgi:hypothetical protein